MGADAVEVTGLGREGPIVEQLVEKLRKDENVDDPNRQKSENRSLFIIHFKIPIHPSH